MNHNYYFYYCPLTESYVREHPWSSRRVILTKEQYNNEIKDLPFFLRDTDTDSGSIQQRIFVKVMKK